MGRKKMVALVVMVGMVFAGMVTCKGGGGQQEQQKVQQQQQGSPQPQTTAPQQEIDPMKLKGIGPVQKVELTEQINEQWAKEGEEIFKLKCTACHQLDQKLIGPPLRGVTTRRTPEWIMNMMLNPMEMTQKDPLAKKLLEEYKTPMTPMGLNEEQARKVLEYLRKADREAGV